MKGADQAGAIVPQVEIGDATAPCWVGLDIGRESISLCVVDQRGRITHSSSCAATGQDVLAVLKPIHAASAIQVIAIEAGCNWKLSRELESSGLPIVHFETRQASRFLQMRRNKTDNNDAFGLAELGRTSSSLISQVPTKAPRLKAIRTQLMLRHRLIVTRLSLETALKEALGDHGIKLASGRGLGSLSAKVHDNAALIRDTGINETLDLQLISKMVDDLRRYVKEQDRRLTKLAESEDPCRRMMTVPGVGVITALSFYSLIGDPARFARSDQVAAYLGLTPAVKQSGNIRLVGRITKMGNSLTRTHLFNAAQSLLYTNRQDSALKRWGLKLLSHSRSRVAKIAVARKLSILLLTLWKSGGTFRPFPEEPTA